MWAFRLSAFCWPLAENHRPISLRNLVLGRELQLMQGIQNSTFGLPILFTHGGDGNLSLLIARRCWGQWRVFYYTEDGQLAYFPASWTDTGESDPFVVLSAGRAAVRFEDLLRLVELIRDLKAGAVKEIRPDV
jgi:hypothetical protein